MGRGANEAVVAEAAEQIATAGGELIYVGRARIEEQVGRCQVGDRYSRECQVSHVATVRICDDVATFVVHRLNQALEAIDITDSERANIELVLLRETEVDDSGRVVVLLAR